MNVKHTCRVIRKVGFRVVTCRHTACMFGFIAMEKECIDKLLAIEKKILDNDDNFLDSYVIDMEPALRLRIGLGSEYDGNLRFELNITQSRKFQIRINLHLLDDDSKIGLSRLDYNSSHRNPASFTDDTPMELRKYAGKWFANESHIHYAVNGFSDLAWAAPLSEIDFPVKDINKENLYGTFGKAIQSFAGYLNIRTKIIINPLAI